LLCPASTLCCSSGGVEAQPASRFAVGPGLYLCRGRSVPHHLWIAIPRLNITPSDVEGLPFYHWRGAGLFPVCPAFALTQVPRAGPPQGGVAFGEERSQPWSAPAYTNKPASAHRGGVWYPSTLWVAALQRSSFSAPF